MHPPGRPIVFPVAEGMAEILDEMVALRRHLHAHPELGFQEHATAELIALRLAQWGYQVTRGVGRTGVVGSLTVGQGTRRLGFRADMDALPIQERSPCAHASRRPGVMHACGHDGHTATLLAAARVLAATRAFSGTLHLIFQPAEEALGGAQSMLDDGLLERFPCDRLYGFHNAPGAPAGRLGVRDGVHNASQDLVFITVRGRGGHAAKPHLVVDPILVASHLVIALQTLVSRETHPDEFAIVSVGALHAGDAPNVIPDSAELRLSVRTRSDAARERLRRRITEMAHAQAAVHRAEAEVDYRWCHPATVNDADATAFLRRVVRDFAGDAALIPDWPAGTASDDMGVLLQRVPGCYFNVGNGTGEEQGEGGCPVHHAQYDFNDAILPTTASVFVQLALAYLTDHPRPQS